MKPRWPKRPRKSCIASVTLVPSDTSVPGSCTHCFANTHGHLFRRPPRRLLPVLPAARVEDAARGADDGTRAIGNESVPHVLRGAALRAVAGNQKWNMRHERAQILHLLGIGSADDRSHG